MHRSTARPQACKERIDSEAESIKEARAELTNETKRLAKEKKNLTLDENLLCQARRLPEIREQLSSLKRERGQLEGRRSGLVEGSEKLEEGICPFFQEPCQNIAGRKPRDVFSAKQEELDRKLTRLASDIDKLSQEETSQKKLLKKSRRYRSRSMNWNGRMWFSGSAAKKSRNVKKA